MVSLLLLSGLTQIILVTAALRPLPRLDHSCCAQMVSWRQMVPVISLGRSTYTTPEDSWAIALKHPCHSAKDSDSLSQDKSPWVFTLQFSGQNNRLLGVTSWSGVEEWFSCHFCFWMHVLFYFLDIRHSNRGCAAHQSSARNISLEWATQKQIKGH